jgi:hypothetical protein
MPGGLALEIMRICGEIFTFLPKARISNGVQRFKSRPRAPCGRYATLCFDPRLMLVCARDHSTRAGAQKTGHIAGRFAAGIFPKARDMVLFGVLIGL